MNDIREIILLSIALVVPIVLFKTGRQRLLLGWVCITLFVQIFDTSLITNLPAGRIVGLMYLPAAVLSLGRIIKIRPVKLWLLNYGYLIILGVIFGFLWPWTDSTMMRPYTLTAPGRAIIYSVRLLSDFSLAVFVANQFRQPGTLIIIVRSMVIGATLSSIVGILYLVTGFDLAYAINGFEDQFLTAERAHGLSAEPRGLGLASAYTLMFLLVGQKKLFRFWPLMIIINLIALLASSSTSALALVLAGIVIGWVFFSNRTRLAILASSAFAILIISISSIILPEQFEAASRIIGARVDPELKLSGIPPGSFGQEIAYRLDVFDSSALLFLLDQPVYILTGAGPGMVSLPASYYVPPGLYSAIWTPETGINSPPFHGILLEISNSGILGLILWLAQAIICWNALRWLARRKNLTSGDEDWEYALSVFVIGAVFYLIQVSISPVWSIILGIGWASVLAMRKIQNVSD